MKLVELLFLLFLVFTTGYQIKKNVVVYTLNNTAEKLIDFAFLTNSRYGYSYIVFSKSNTSFEDGVVFMSYKPQDSPFVYGFFQGKNSSQVSKVTTTANTTIFKGIRDYTPYPLGFYYGSSALMVSFYSKFMEKYSFPLYIFVGQKKNSLPRSLTDFDEKLDETVWFTVDKFDEKIVEIASPDYRLENYHPAIYSVTLAYYLLIFIIMIPISFFQPLKSRGIVPFIAVGGQFLHLFSDFIAYALTIEQWTIAYCAIWFLLQNPLILAIISINLIYISRYILLVILNYQKEEIIKDSKKYKEFNVLFYIVKVSGHWLFTLFIFILFFFLYFIVFLSILIADNFRCTRDPIDLVHSGIIIGIGLLYVILMILDLIITYMHYKGCDLLQFWHQDTLYFKIEIYLIGIPLFIIFGIVVIIQVFISLYFELDVSVNASYILNTILFHLLLFYQAIFVTIVTLIKIISSCFKKSKDVDILVEILSNPTTKDVFYEFCKTEFSTENYSCYTDIQAYKALLDESKRLESIQSIYDLYLNGTGSKLEINVSKSVCAEVKKAIEEKSLHPESLKTLESMVVVNLSDTYSRFIFYPPFINVKKIQKKFVEMNDT